jgi:SAM-dependent methyltransferase
LDIPSGTGRHSRLLAAEGYRVVAADLDYDLLKRACTTESGGHVSAIGSVRLDATRALPFKPSTFDLALVVHFQVSEVLRHIEPVLKDDGVLIVETFGGNGENWRMLPRLGEIHTQLSSAFTLLKYNERPVKRKPAYVTVKLVARKK